MTQMKASDSLDDQLLLLFLSYLSWPLFGGNETVQLNLSKILKHVDLHLLSCLYAETRNLGVAAVSSFLFTSNELHVSAWGLREAQTPTTHTHTHTACSQQQCTDHLLWQMSKTMLYKNVRLTQKGHFGKS